ncbi:MAG: YicC family protein [Rhodospirillaceae bacterium]|nr:MAG: YicC family protein [Rhodospirillaceae bacterium]
MTISSMTGFSRAAGNSEACVWAWEAKSVNGKGLDVRVRVPRGFDGLESAARDRVTKRFRRGNISLSLDLTWSQPQTGVAVNEDVLAQVLKAVAKVQDACPSATPPTADGLLGLRGVLEQVELQASAADLDVLQSQVLESLDQALEQLSEDRGAEGQRLGGVLHDQLAEIEILSEQAAGLASLFPEAIRQRLKSQVELLTQDIEAVNPERLAQEAALLMVKADVREELDRLSAHIEAARDLLGQNEPVGRRLDFLCQEFNRETNTLCSKSTDTQLTRIGLDLKAVIEQFREQVQNIE